MLQYGILEILKPQEPSAQLHHPVAVSHLVTEHADIDKMVALLMPQPSVVHSQDFHIVLLAKLLQPVVMRSVVAYDNMVSPLLMHCQLQLHICRASVGSYNVSDFRHSSVKALPAVQHKLQLSRIYESSFESL